MQACDAILEGRPIPAEIIPHVKVLDLAREEISDLKPLSVLTALRELSLDETDVSDITPLSSLTELQKLWLENTDVSDLTPLSGLTALWVLGLQGAKVTDFSPVAHVKYVYKDWEKYMNDQTEDYMQVREIKSCTYRDWDGELLFESQVKAVVHDDNLGDVHLKFNVIGGLKEAEDELRRLFPNHILHSAVKPETKNNEHETI
jgi:Leucine-rich repeat (LRR) protein